MPRSNRPRRKAAARPRAERREVGNEQPAPTVQFAGEWWHYRDVRGNGSGRTYVCPGCQQDVPASSPHTVAWPSASMQGVENRRHWHTRCWGARDRRPPHGSFA